MRGYETLTILTEALLIRRWVRAVAALTMVVSVAAMIVPTSVATAASAPPTTEPELDVSAARTGFSEVLASRPKPPVAEDLPCPLATPRDVETAMRHAGLDLVIDDWRFDPYGAPGRLVDVVLGCVQPLNTDSPDRPSVLLLVADVGWAGAAHRFLELDGVTADSAMVPATLPGATYGVCEQVSDSRSQCRDYWQVDGFIVGTYVSGPGISRADAAQVLEQLVPVVVDNLARP